MSKNEKVLKYEFEKLMEQLSVPSLKDYTDKKYFSEKDLEILKEYYPIGGAKLCKEKGIKKSSIAIRVKYEEICNEDK